MKLCVFSGTFNPIHNAHLRVGRYVLQTFNFDKILFIPAYIPPHKDCLNIDASHRFNMVKIAIEGQNGFEVSDIEYRRNGKSYSYLTICELYNMYNIEGRINFIIGTDAFKNLPSWYEFDKLKTLVKFIVFVREHDFNVSEYDYLKKLGVEFEFQMLPYEDISSTSLRELIKEDKDISSYVPKEEQEYIRNNGLYKD